MVISSHFIPKNPVLSRLFLLANSTVRSQLMTSTNTIDPDNELHRDIDKFMQANNLSYEPDKCVHL